MNYNESLDYLKSISNFCAHVNLFYPKEKRLFLRRFFREPESVFCGADERLLQRGCDSTVCFVRRRHERGEGLEHRHRGPGRADRHGRGGRGARSVCRHLGRLRALF